MLFFLIGCLYITDEERQEWAENNPDQYFTSPALITPESGIYVGTELTCQASAKDGGTENELTPSYRWVLGGEAEENEVSTESVYTPSADEVSVGDEIRCIATVVNSLENTVTSEASVILENTAPVFNTEATISPDSEIYTGTELTCSASGADDNDGELEVSYLWLSDGVELGTGETYTVSTEEVEVGAQISCAASITDLNEEITTSEASITVLNSEPTLSNIALSQTSEVYNDSSLTCSATGEDADEDVTVEYSWQRNGANIATGSDIDLGSHNISPDQEITCIASVSDSDGGEASDSVSVTIENREPTVDSVDISNQSPEADDSLSCTGTASDEDGENPQIIYSWEIGGNVVGTNPNLTLNPSFATVGEDLTCTVTASDGYGGADSLIETAVIQNTTPTFSSSASITPNTGVYVDSVLSCSATATDLNDGSITPTYLWYSGGAQIGSGSTYTVSSVQVDVGDSIDCVASVEDNDGDTVSSQVSVIVQNSAPTVSGTTIIPDAGIFNDSILLCSATAADPNEMVTAEYSWERNGIPISVGGSIDLSLYGVTPTSSISCIASVTDSQGESDSDSAFVVVGNRAPEVDSLLISNSFPEADDTLSCLGTGTDEDGEIPSISYSWELGGNIVGTNSNISLDPSFAGVGESLTCTMTVSDGYGGFSSNSATALIQNTSPTITQAAISPGSNADTTSLLTCSAIGDDLNDGSLTPTYIWTNGSNEIGTGATLQVDPSLAMPGDVVNCAAEVTDGAGETASSSDSVSIGNALPVFTAPTEISPNTGVYTDTELSCSSTVEDSEDGALTPSYAWKLNGVLLSTGNSFTISAAQTDVGNVISCLSTVTDSHGGIQTSEAFVTIENTLPTVTDVAISIEAPYNDEVIFCSATIADPDETLTETYSWEWDGLILQTGQGVGGSAFDLSTTGLMPGEIVTCLVEVEDEHGEMAVDAASITIGNRDPSVPEVSISRSGSGVHISEAEDFICSGTSTDDDGEPVTISYRWTSDNGDIIFGDTLGSADTSGDETWTCIVNVYDALGGANQNTAEIYVYSQQDATYLPDWLKCDTQDAVRSFEDAQYQFIEENTWDQVGYAISSAGDVDGDGLDDILIGAKENDDAANNAGKVYLILGSSLGGSSTIDLAHADYSFLAEDEFDNAGASVSSADVDNDGLNDILIGAPYNDDGGSNAGKVYLILGSSLGSNSTINLADADYEFIGESAEDNLGASVSSAGDVDGDGLDDLLFGAPYNDERGENAGKGYLFFGSSLGINSIIYASQADYTFVAEGANDNAATSVSSAGDVDNDGLDDVLVGVPNGDDNGKAHLILGSRFGSLGSTPTIYLSSADYEFVGEDIEDRAGKSVSSAGDVDGDGLDDILVGAPYNDNNDFGKAYLILGSSLSSTSSIDLANADYEFIGENNYDLAGASVSSAGDIDDDGLDDILIGAYNNSEGGTSAGKAYLILGSSLSSTSSIDISTADYAFVGANDGDSVGYTVSSAGDVNGDGLSDILMGLTAFNGGGGDTVARVGLFTGCSPNTLPSVPEISLSATGLSTDLVCDISVPSMDVEGHNIEYLFTWLVDGAPFVNTTTTNFTGDTVPNSELVGGQKWDCSVQASDGYGSSTVAETSFRVNAWTFIGDVPSSIASAGDVDNDGLEDFLIGADLNSEGGQLAGKVYLFLGSSLTTTEMLDLSQADYEFVGEWSFDQAGHALSSAGDVDNDGLDDILIGAYGRDTGGNESGTVYLILGSSLGSNTTIDLADADYEFIGENSADYAGWSVSSAGDVDGDGLDDFLIGAYGYTNGTVTDTGKTYVIFGSSLGGASTIQLSSVSYYLTGDKTYDRSGWKVSGAGDVDGDGLDDILVGAHNNDDGGQGSGNVYLILGSSFNFSPAINLANADYEFVGEEQYDEAGYSISSGDVDGDGLSDILVGAKGSDANGSNSGKAYLILGSSVGPNSSIDLSQADYSFIGENSGDNAGKSVSLGSDIDGDGLSDILIGAPNNGDNGNYAGKVYVVLASSLSSGSMNLSQADYSFVGASGATLGENVSSAGDIDGDGFDEILYTAPQAEVPGASSDGACYLQKLQ